jgi:hypothetical protein
MMRFCGFDLDLSVETVFARQGGPGLCAARDCTGGQWLIACVDDDPNHLAWLCAPVSERGLQAVADGRAQVIDALRHSATGTVELVTVDHGRAVPDRCLLCAELPNYLVPSVSRPVALAA